MVPKLKIATAVLAVIKVGENPAAMSLLRFFSGPSNLKKYKYGLSENSVVMLGSIFVIASSFTLNWAIFWNPASRMDSSFNSLEVKMNSEMSVSPEKSVEIRSG